MIICVTGPMAAGKNTVSSILVQEGWRSADADELVHKAIERVSPQIIRAFAPEAAKRGITLAKPDGTLDRRALGMILFADDRLLAVQESIVFPEVTRLSEDFIAENRGTDIVLNATVLYKIPFLMSRCSAIIYVTAPVWQRLLRAHKRDGMPLKQIAARFKRQAGLYRMYRKTGIPVITVRNSGSADSLRAKTLGALKQIRKKA